MRFTKLIPEILVVAVIAMVWQGKVEVNSNGISFGNSVQTVSADSLHLDPAEGLVYFNGKPFTGTSQSFYPNGQMASSIEYRQGKKHGLYRKWYEDGLLSFESEYLDGKQHGTARTWWRNGILRSESNFQNGVPNGVQKQWYSSGALFKKINLVNGKEQGLQQAWRRNGKLYINYEARNGRIFGLKRATLCYQLDDESLKLDEDE